MFTQLFATLPFVVCAVWFTSLLLDYIASPTAVRLRLVAFMLVAALLYLGHLTYFSDEMVHFWFMDAIYGACNLAVYPLYLIYIVQLTKGCVQRGVWWLLLPSVVAGIGYTTFYLLMSREEIELFVSTYLYHGRTNGLTGLALWQAYVHRVAKTVFVLLVLTTLWYGTTLLRHFRARVHNYYSDTEGRTLKPVSILLYLFVITSALSIILNIIGRELFNDKPAFLSIPSLLFTTLLFGIGYVGSREMFSHIDFEQDEAAERESSHGDSGDVELISRMEELARRIEWLMQEERFYLQPNLRVSDLARRLGTNSKYISQATNQILGLPFADYVNRYRVQHAQRLRQQRPDLSVSELANQSGYLSMQSFYRNIRKWGQTN